MESVAPSTEPPAPGRSVRIGRIAGIPVGISPWWLVIVALLTWTLSGDYADQSPAAAIALGLAAVLCLFAGPDEPAAALLELPAYLTRGRAVVVDADRRPLGVVSITDLERRRQASPQTAAPARHGPAGVPR